MLEIETAQNSVLQVEVEETEKHCNATLKHRLLCPRAMLDFINVFSKNWLNIPMNLFKTYANSVKKLV